MRLEELRENRDAVVDVEDVPDALAGLRSTSAKVTRPLLQRKSPWPALLQLRAGEAAALTGEAAALAAEALAGDEAAALAAEGSCWSWLRNFWRELASKIPGTGEAAALAAEALAGDEAAAAALSKAAAAAYCAAAALAGEVAEALAGEVASPA